MHSVIFGEATLLGLTTSATAAVVNCCGTANSDRIFSASGVDVIIGLDGDGLIYGMDGGDIICAGEGNDTVIAGDGDDFVWGSGGVDYIWAATPSTAPTPSIIFGATLAMMSLGVANWRPLPLATWTKTGLTAEAAQSTPAGTGPDTSANTLRTARRTTTSLTLQPRLAKLAANRPPKHSHFLRS
ncbi:MAG: hypothetical protein GWP91_23845 [Rhodobacterales bacterium]|nr:hypothetical protein [Rhodobacterales bacterium]